MNPFLQDSPVSVLPSATRVVVIGDIHGDLQRLVKCLYASKLINTKLEWVAEPADTVLVQLGDQVDSLNRTTGQSWEKMVDLEVVKFMEAVRKAAEKKGGKVVSILGNHEIMNVFGNFMYVSPPSMEKSGGENGRRQIFRPGSELCKKILSKRPVVCKVGSLVFCHGGLLPQHLYAVQGNIKFLNEVVQKMLLGEHLHPLESDILSVVINDANGIIWSRFYHESSEEMVRETLESLHGIMGTTALVLGHTPQQRIMSRANGAVWFADVGISRSFGTQEYQLLEIWHDGVACPENGNAPLRITTIHEN